MSITPAALITCAALSLALATSQLTAQSKTTAAGVYTEEQAVQGERSARDKCTSCHGTDYLGRGFATSLIGEDFFQTFGNRSLADFYAIVKTMPIDKPGSLTEKEYVDITAFLLKANQFPAGMSPLVGDSATLSEITIVPPHGALR